MRFVWGVRSAVIRSALAAIALTLTSCSASWHLKRAIAKDPTIVQDTVVRMDTTVITKSVELRDTVTLLEVDTITIESNGVVVGIRRYYDTLLVDVECPPDTITVFQEHIVRQVTPPKKDKVGYTIGGVLGFIIALVVVKIAGQVIK